jgi:hypothetical protein
MCQQLLILKTICLRVLPEDLGFRECYFRWIPHFLSGDPLLSVTVVFTSKTSKSLKSPKTSVISLQVSHFLSGDPLLSVITVFTSKTSQSLKSPRNTVITLQASRFLSGDPLLSATIVFTSKTSKSFKSPQIHVISLQVSLFLSRDRLLSCSPQKLQNHSNHPEIPLFRSTCHFFYRKTVHLKIFKIT